MRVSFQIKNIKKNRTVFFLSKLSHQFGNISRFELNSEKKFEKLDTTTASVLYYRAYQVTYFKLPILYSCIYIIHLKILIFSLQSTKISMQYFNDKLMPTLFQICIRVTIAR